MRHVRDVVLKLAALALMLLGTARATAETVTANDTARFLAGMPPSANSPLVALTRDPAWQRHARFFDNAFAELERRQLSKIHAWADANLAAPKPTIFSMFSGPNFISADAFYAKATPMCSARWSRPDRSPMSPGCRP